MGDVVDMSERRAARNGGEPWLSKREAAAHLSVTTRCLTNWQRDRGLPFRQVGGVNLYRRSELDEWVERQHAAAAAETIG